MTQLLLRFKKVIFVLSLHIVFSNGKPCYSIRRLLQNVFKEVSAANIYQPNIEDTMDKFPYNMKKFLSE